MRGLLALAGLQASLVAVWLLVPTGRSPEVPFLVEPLDEAPPPLAVLHGEQARSVPDSAHLVHFWATWCAPCVEELPGLLAATESEGVPLLAVTDEPWPVVQAWFGGNVPDAIVHDPSAGAAAGWRVSGLPDTFVVVGGRAVGRMGGPRDWTSPAARRFLREVAP